jgi:addiction module RelB/DinJ family antitoxin
MSLGNKSAMLQARVYPEIKLASERVLQRIGLTMTDAMDLFLRRMIIDQRIPFDVVALDDTQVVEIAEGYEGRLKHMKTGEKTSGNRSRRTKPKRE